MKTKMRLGIAGGIFLMLAALVYVWVYVPNQATAATLESEPSNSAETLTYTVNLPLVTLHWEDRDRPFGAQFYGPLNETRGIDLAGDAGMEWVRWPIPWSSVEPDDVDPSLYNWSGIDQNVNGAKAENINLIFTISSQPAWAAEYRMGPLTDTATIKEFVGELVERYDGDGYNDAPGSPVIEYFELYNEPDNTSEWHATVWGFGLWGNKGAEYASLMKELYPVIKASNPDAKLVLGGLALDWYEEAGGPFDGEFLDDVLAACQGHPCFDVMNFHYYPLFWEVWGPYGEDIIGKRNYVYQKLDEYGYGDKPIICTEAGWTSAGEWGSEELQSRYVAKLYTRSLVAGLDIVVWYRMGDWGDLAAPGLIADDGPKPAYEAYGVMTDMLWAATYQQTLELAEPLEGYQFTRHSARMDVVWTNDETWTDATDDPIVPYVVAASALRVTDKYGNEVMAYDEDDGTTDGKVTILVGGSPLYLEYNP